MLADACRGSEGLSLLSESVRANCSVILSVSSDEREADVVDEGATADRGGEPLAGGDPDHRRGDRPAGLQRADGVAVAGSDAPRRRSGSGPWQPRTTIG